MFPWHHTLYQQLTASFLAERGHHALLFKTETGLGTTALIETFAQWLFCLQPQGALPCEQCKSCTLWHSGNHPDFHLITTIENKDIGVDQIREMTETLQQFAQQGGNVVIFIQHAERLTEAAANALLKTLEEPQPKVYFLLEAPLQSAMLATIQSRCQTWLVNAPDFAQAYEWLQTQCPEHSPQEIETALRLCHARPLLCKKFLENDRLPQRKAFLQTFWRFYKSGDVWLLLNAFDKEQENALAQLEWLGSFFSDALKAKMNITTNWLNPDLQNGILPFSQALTPQQLLKGDQILQQAQRDLREINAVNQELILADMLTKLVSEVFGLA
ncbi:DNA polymerase III subunit delta' [Pasteurellaceae bacterium Macca]|nr:DNA polymerase III subunit delta' [Pasteurellaceae bacterium Macca]